MIELAKVGALASDPGDDGIPVRFGLYLPRIGSDFRVVVLVIHALDRFTAHIPAQAFELEPAADAAGFWQADVVITRQADTHFGQAGRYLYRYQLLRRADGQVVTPWFTDPFARATDDVGQLSAFDTPGHLPPHDWHDDDWKVPNLAELVVYELHVEEFNGTFAGLAARLPYLKSLGVTCLELMPITSLKLDFDWGYGPLHFLAPNQRWGGPNGLKELVDLCHQDGIAVIVDVVFQHVDDSFPYYQVYRDAGVPSPMIDGIGDFGPKLDYTKEFTGQYVRTVTQYFLDEYHVDGFRYDEVTDLFDDRTGAPYLELAKDVYSQSLRLARFTPSGGREGSEYSRIIQVPEALWRAKEVLRRTVSTSAWQDDLLNKAENVAMSGSVDDQFVNLLDVGFSDNPYLRTQTVEDINGDAVDMPAAPFQYIATHDHSYPVAFLTAPDPNKYLQLAPRDRWYKLQPLVIALYTASGVPMLWQGQEFNESYRLPDAGDLRIHFRRDLHWEYFYDAFGSPMIRLHRILGQVRAGHPALRGPGFYYFNQSSDPSSGIVCYRRYVDEEDALVFLNFADQQRSLAIPAPVTGNYRERIDDHDRPTPLQIQALEGQQLTVTVPPNYGYIFTTTG